MLAPAQLRSARRSPDSGGARKLSAMGEERENPGSRGLSDALREAVEKTVTASSEALDEVTKRSREARETVSQRAGEARESVSQRSQRGQEASASVATRVAEAADGMRPATRDEVRELGQQVEELAKRIADLEAKPKVDP